MKLLTRAEEVVLLAIWTLQNDAYSIQIQKQLHEATGKKWSLGTIFGPLERLEKRKLVTSYLSDSTPERGGRHKRIYQLTDEGKKILVEIRNMSISMWKNIPELSLKVK
ncbi:PadR family transcriptional regulator [candidate division KSB1 bacterium]